jgi:hypothetical protein
MVSEAKAGVLERIQRAIERDGIEEVRQKLSAAFKKAGVRLENIESRMGKGIAKWEKEELAVLYGDLKAIQDGVESAQALFPDPEEKKPEDGGKTRTDKLKDKLNVKDEPEPAPEPEPEGTPEPPEETPEPPDDSETTPAEAPAEEAGEAAEEEKKTADLKAVRGEAMVRDKTCRNPECPNHGKAGRPLEVDHVQPKSQGGPDTLENRISFCPTCHYIKHHGATGEDGQRTTGYEFILRVLDHYKKLNKFCWSEDSYLFVKDAVLKKITPADHKEEA